MVRIFNQYVPVRTLLLFILEALLIGLSVVGAFVLDFGRSFTDVFESLTLSYFGYPCLLVIATFQMCFYYHDLYGLASVSSGLDQLARIAQAFGIGSLILALLYCVFPSLPLNGSFFLIAVVWMVAAAPALRAGVDAVWRRAVPPENVLVMGTGPLAAMLASELKQRADVRVNLIGYVERSGQPRYVDGKMFSLEELESVTQHAQVRRIIVALEDRRGVLPVERLVQLRMHGIRIDDAHSTLAALTGRIALESLRPSWFIFTEGFRRSFSFSFLKRLLDLAFALAGLVCSLPLMLAVALAIRIESQGPVLYRQVRIGLNGRLFHVLKFRSMRLDAEAGGAQWARQNDSRVTRVGRFIRKFRLDELPQFLNVLRGDMSFVGPRPERPEFVETLQQVIPFYSERHSVRPGITGWAQVKYQYGSSVEDARRKLEYDLFYLKNASVLFDCAIVLQTVRIVLLGTGAR